MRRTLSFLFAMMLLLPLAGCKPGETPPEEEGRAAFNATVLEVYEGGSVLVEPFADEEAILRSADRITFGKNSLVSDADMPELTAGDTIRVTFDGTIAESYPAQLMRVYAVDVVEANRIGYLGE